MILPGDDKRWSVVQNSDMAGLISRTRNVNLTKRGLVALERKAQLLYSSDDDTDFDTPTAIVSDQTNDYVVTSGGTFAATLGSGSISISQVPTSGQPTHTVASDGVYFAGEVQVSGTTTVRSWDGSIWNSRISSLASSGSPTFVPHPLCVFENRLELAVADYSGGLALVKTYNTSYSLQNTLQLPGDYVVVWMRWRQNKLYIGTRNIVGGKARMFVWNGTGSAAQEAYDVKADWLYSGVEYLNAIVVITSAGQILRFNGGGFDELAAFPVYYSAFPWTANANKLSAIGKVKQRGMTVEGDRLLICVEGENELDPQEYPGNFLPEQPSGLWCYDPQVGLYHRAGFVYSKFDAKTVLSVTSSKLRFLSDHNAQTGDAVLASSVSNISELVEDQIYFAIRESEKDIRLALSPADALAGRYLTLSGTPSGDTITFDVLDSTGAVLSASSGPVFAFNKNRPNVFHGTTLLYCGKVLNRAGVEKSVLTSLGMGRNVGSFTTIKLPTANITATQQKLYLKFRNLNLDTDEIRVKWRTKERFGMPTPIHGTVTWIDGESFTVDTTELDFRGAEIGDEVDIISGAGAGYTAHISEIDGATSIYTVTLDEEVPGISAGGLSSIVVDNWTKHPTLINSDLETASQGYAQLTDFGVSTWIQFKIELRGFNVQVEELQPTNSAAKRAV